MARAHPRSRGEHGGTPDYKAQLEGSSPLTRGARPRQLEGIVHLGLIPAHAGSTNFSSYSATHAGAHPRSRGEHRLRPTNGLQSSGSSPLTRGALDYSTATIDGFRLIPAHAGSTNLIMHLPRSHRAHPRSRGEHHSTMLFRHCDEGSSPLTRGAPSPNCGGGGCPQQRGTTCSPR